MEVGVPQLPPADESRLYLFLCTQPSLCGILASYIWEGGCGAIFPVSAVCGSQRPLHFQIGPACVCFLLLVAIKLTHSEDSSTFPITLNCAACWSCPPTLAITLFACTALHAPLALCLVIVWVLHCLSKCPMPHNMSVNLFISSALNWFFCGFHCVLPRLLILVTFSPTAKWFYFSFCANLNEI